MDNAISSAAARYDREGYAIVTAFDSQQCEIVQSFAKRWLVDLLARSSGKPVHDRSIASYHRWFEDLGIDHGEVFRAPNRHCLPPEEVCQALINQPVRAFLTAIGIARYELWDEGLGTVGFRLIRPGFGDGYPWTRKTWGIAMEVVSCWIPIVGRDPDQTLTLVPGSHRKEYKKYLPEDQKFRRDEYRLSADPATLETVSPSLEPEEVVFFHPRTLHSEDVTCGDITRYSLEYRIQPLGDG